MSSYLMMLLVHMGKQLGCQCLAGRNKTCFAVCLCREYSGPRGRWTFRQAALSQLLDVSSSHYHHHNWHLHWFQQWENFLSFLYFCKKNYGKKTFAITWILMSVQNLNFMYIYLLFTKNILNAVEFVCFSFFWKIILILKSIWRRDILHSTKAQ